MSFLRTLLWSFIDVQDLKSSRHRNASKYSENTTEGRESRIPLLPHAMVDGKLKTNSPIIEAVGSDSESNSQDVVMKYKAPWWSYIWVRLAWIHVKRRPDLCKGL